MYSKKVLIGGLLVIASLVGAPFLYTYIVEKPPTFLIELVTKQSPPPPLPLGDVAPLTVPSGFTATIFSREVPGARVFVRDPLRTLLVSSTKGGIIYALPDEDGDNRADRAQVVLSGLSQPHGIAVNCTQGLDGSDCILYVAETGELKSYSYNPRTLTAEFKETIATFPTGGGHFTRTILFDATKTHLLVSIGSSCNVCVEDDPRRASVQSISLETNEMTPLASGLRNSVFMALHPITGALFASENGRDIIGDDIPPDEINIIEKGKTYGWPYCYGKGIRDTRFKSSQAKSDECATTEPSYIDLPAHSAALGLAFIPKSGWPEEMHNDLLVAYHGSWNRSELTGYKVVRIDLDENGAVSNGAPAETDFVSGFLAAGASEKEALGRPVGLLVENGGVVYVSDDRAGAVYRVARDATR